MRYFLPLNSGRDQCFGLAFHSGLTSRASCYAPPDTVGPNLQLAAVEYLPSIEGAGRICRSAPFCGEGFLYLLCTLWGRGAEMVLGAVFFRLCKLGELWYNRENYKNHEGLV